MSWLVFIIFLIILECTILKSTCLQTFNATNWGLYKLILAKPYGSRKKSNICIYIYVHIYRYMEKELFQILWLKLLITNICGEIFKISHLLSFPYHYHYLFLHSPTELKSLRTRFSMWSNTSLSLSIGNSLPLDVTLLVTLSLGCMGWCSPGATSVLRLPSSSLLWWILFSWLCILLLGYTFISVDLILLQLPKDGCAGSEIAAILQSWRCLSLFFNVLFYIRI